MKFNEAGLQLIKSFEGCELTVYIDLAGIPTVGFGHRLLPNDNLKVGDIITQDQADRLLQQDLQKFINGTDNLVQTNINDNQFSALVSFAYNLGLGTLSRSTLLNDINTNALGQASGEFLKWNHINGIVNFGLTRRRLAEQALFNTLA